MGTKYIHTRTRNVYIIHIDNTISPYVWGVFKKGEYIINQKTLDNEIRLGILFPWNQLAELLYDH